MGRNHPRTAFPPRRLVCPKGEPSSGTKGHEGTCAPGSRLHDLRRLQSDDYQSSGGSATNVFNCAKVHRNIDQVATPPPRRHAGQPSNPPSFLPSGYQSHTMIRTRHPQMTVRFENCSDPVADQGGSAQIRVGRNPDLCYPWGNPLLHRFYHFAAHRRHRTQAPLPLYSPCPDFFRGIRARQKTGTRTPRCFSMCVGRIARRPRFARECRS